VSGDERVGLCCHSNKTCAPIANPPRRAQLEGTPSIPPSYIRARALVWACGCGQTDTQAARGRDH